MKKHILSLLLVAAIAITSVQMLGFSVSAESTATATDGWVTFEDDFNRSDREINGDNGWYSQCTVPDPAKSTVIENNYLLAEDFSISADTGSGNGATASFTQRPVSESAINQKVSADILNLAEFTYYTSANLHLRYARSASNYIQGPDTSYFVMATVNYIAIGYVPASWSDRVIISDKAWFAINKDHTYRLEFTAEGSAPTKLTATLYDVTAGGVAVTTVSVTDNTSVLQSAATVALSTTGNSWMGQAAAKFDNFKYSYIPEDGAAETPYISVFADDFNRADGAIGNDWHQNTHINATVNGDRLELDYKDVYYQYSPNVAAASLVRPMSEATLNQVVEVDFQRQIGFVNLGAAIIARAQDEVINANSYILSTRFNYDSPTGWLSEITLSNTTGDVFREQFYVDASKDYSFRLKLIVNSISDTETELEALLYDVTDGAESIIYNKKVTDSDAKLQAAGTAGMGIYSYYEGGVITVSNFNYMTVKQGESEAISSNTIYDFYEAEALEVYKNKYEVVADAAASDGNIVKATDNSSDAYVAYAVNVEETGEYPARLRFRLGGSDSYSGEIYAPVVVNGKDEYKFTGSGSLGELTTSEPVLVKLNAGVNIIYCMAPSKALAESIGNAYIDYDCLFLSKDVSSAKGDFYIAGDANKNGTCDVRDLVRFKRYMSDKSTDIDKFAVDLNSTGNTVDSLDLAQLRKYLLKVNLNNGEYSETSWLHLNNFVYSEKSEMLSNTYYKLNTKNMLNIAYFGGSITCGYNATETDKVKEDAESWRAKTTNWFREQYPNATINEIYAAIGGNGSTFGVYRAVEDLQLESDTQKPDLVFIEFAINDFYDSVDANTVKRNMEYIIRTIYEYSPTTDIMVVLTGERTNMNVAYETSAAHKYIAERYKLPCINVATMLWDQMLADANGNYPWHAIWDSYFSDWVHPNANGYEKYYQYITGYIGEIFASKQSVPQSTTAPFIPEKTLTKLPVAAYRYNFKGQSVPSPLAVSNDGYLAAYTPTTFTVKFTGSELKLRNYATPQSGRLVARVDGGEPIIIDLYRNSANFVPRTVAYDLENKEHTVEFTLESTENGCEMQICDFLISGSNLQNGVTIVQ